MVAHKCKPKHKTNNMKHMVQMKVWMFLHFKISQDTTVYPLISKLLLFSLCPCLDHKNYVLYDNLCYLF